MRASGASIGSAAAADGGALPVRRPSPAAGALLTLALLPSPPQSVQGPGPRGEAIEALRQNDLERAERLARDWLEQHPHDTEITRLLGMVLVTAGMQLEGENRVPSDYTPLYEESLEVLLRAEELGGDRRQPGLDHAVGYLLLHHDRHAEAEERLDRAIEAAPGNFVLYRLRGTARREQGRYAAAEEDFRRAIALDADDLASRLFLARTLELQGRGRDAADSLREYYAHIEGHPPDERHFRVLYEIAGYTLLLNDLAGAREPLEKACRLRPSDSVCRSELGQLYYELEEPDRAVPELDAVIADPEAPADVLGEALHHRALIAHDRGEHQRAIELLERALQISPHESESLKALAAALKKEGERERAREVLGRLREVVEVDNEITRLRGHLRSSPRDRAARVELAQLLLDLERWEEARREIEALRGAGPAASDVAELTRRLELGRR